MTTSLKSILSKDGVEVLATDDPSVFHYIPVARAETSMTGAPTVILVKKPEGSILQLGAKLVAEESALESIRAILKSRQARPSPIRLEPAPLTVNSARLLLTTSSEAIELQRSTTSALSPYTAVFRATLDATQTKTVEDALAGTQGKLSVVYDLEVSTTASAHIQLLGNVTELVGNVTNASTEDDALELIEDALASQKLRATVERSGTDPEHLVEQAWRAAKEKAARMLLGYRTPAAASWSEREDTLKSEVCLQEPRAISLARSTDVAGWFVAGSKPTILATATTAEAASPRTAKVSLGFQTKDVPLAFIEVRGSESQPAVLRPPGFAPILLNTHGTLTLRVHYLGNAPSFATEVAAAGPERILTLEELGLAQITVDASERKSAGAKKLTASVSYIREGREVESWPVRFQFGDWTEQWFVVTGAPTLNGTLRYEWQETGPDGSVTTQGPITTDRTTIQIQKTEDK
jgi:hypothetical protein